jgi:hypothetical protein
MLVFSSKVGMSVSLRLPMTRSLFSSDYSFTVFLPSRKQTTDALINVRWWENATGQVNVASLLLVLSRLIPFYFRTSIKNAKRYVTSVKTATF